MVNLNNSWNEKLKDEFEKSYYIKLRDFLAEEYESKKIFPDKNDIFNALRTTSYEDVKVVILGQDPYHGEGQAHGFSFSVLPGVKTPPSLLNMYKELRDDLGCFIPNNGYLVPWAEQGVLLLNTVLTVREGEANSHRKKGWETFTNKIIELLNEREKPVIFLLWGNNAKEKMGFITNSQHYVLTSVHPSPLSATRGFMGCKHFSKTNEILKSLGDKQINWQIGEI
ncbi:MAG: uracil-DNA glycosylase [Clostridium sp.]